MTTFGAQSGRRIRLARTSAFGAEAERPLFISLHNKVLTSQAIEPITKDPKPAHHKRHFVAAFFVQFPIPL